MTVKNMQLKNGAHRNWSAIILSTTALFDLGLSGMTLLSRKVYQRCPAAQARQAWKEGPMMQ